MLAAVLLHVVEATWPVDRAPHGPTNGRARTRRGDRTGHVHDAAIVDLKHVDDRQAVEDAGDERLPA
jgi:hypothetical protein